MSKTSQQFILARCEKLMLMTTCRVSDQMRYYEADLPLRPKESTWLSLIGHNHEWIGMGPTTNQVSLGIPAIGGTLLADLTLPSDASGLVVFCHGSGSNRHSPRNLHVAGHLQRGGLATLLFDLEHNSDQVDGRTLASLPPLQKRLLSVIDWTSSQPALKSLELGLFGASTGAALALAAAVERPLRVKSVVSRGGRPDLVFQCLGDVRCPVLLIVGGHDLDVLELNAWAAGQLQVRNELVVIPQASHLFSEPGSLDAVADQTYWWFMNQFKQD